APGEAPFVELGNRVSVGQTICILEAMKLMNELEAELSGEVVEILVENGTPVEYNQVLMRVRTS
ncbi:MAG: acetyl-CoA carboxylase, biotin carboxyl carrier protein, partial [Synechococcaceae bacterium WB9_2_170]|nr:acetyl-CoA carboxylase, biotin carboxyl carrier protein [Synechococcaceae bacterium WB9_2_170]